MTSVRDPVLTIGRLDDDEQHRRATISYALELETDGRLAGHHIDELVRLHAVDEHDAAVHPDSRPIAEHHDSYAPAVGTNERAVELVVERDQLDVQRDWWSSGPGGETRPIAEWPDHVAADIVLSRSGRVVATAMTPTVTGSWGILADDTDG
ncbi:MAG: hypothetical protein AAFP84_05000 [Actinomycetota bacterium]